MNIKIKTGTSITKILQTTVSIPQAICELIKNSAQNGAKSCWLFLNKENAQIIDDGMGFNMNSECSGLNGFEKYFIYGSSFEQHENIGLLRLGKMGIGGKISNDRIANEENPHWAITSKNKHGTWQAEYQQDNQKMFLCDQDVKILKDPKVHHPVLNEISSGTLIEIKNLRSSIAQKGWPLDEIKSELSTFFAKDNKIKIFLNGQPVSLKPNFIGTKIPKFSKKFSYKLNNKEKTAKVVFELYFARNKEAINMLVGERIGLYDFAKIKNIETLEQAKVEEFVEKNFENSTVSYRAVNEVFNSLMGSITCEEINTDLDESGLAAKDLGHHNLRPDHPLTKPLESTIFETLVSWIISFSIIDNKEKFSAIDALAVHTSNVVAKLFDEKEIKQSLASNKKTPRVITKTKKFEKNISQMLSVESKEEIDNILGFEEKISFQPISRNDSAKIKEERSIGIPFSIVDFSEKEKHLLSKPDKGENLRVLINSGSNKFNFFEKDSAMNLSMFLAECIIKETCLFINPLATQSEIDLKIEIFYKKHSIEMFNSVNSIKLV